MGQRYKPEPELDGTEPVDGVVTEGRIFFEKPKLFLVGKAEEPSPPRSHYPRGATSGTSASDLSEVEARSTSSRPRLASSRTYVVCQTPVMNVEYPLTMYPKIDEATAYLKQAHINGFGPGAIVTRRHQNNWRYTNVHQWGVILFEIANPPFNQRWNPFEVKWFENQTSIERAWAEDLIVVHAYMDKKYLLDLLESQGITGAT